jgi:PAS domain S-box-containing protein
MENQLSNLGFRPAPPTVERDDAALRESEEKFSKAFYHAPALLALIRLTDGVCIDVNKRFETVSGYRREEVIGRTSVEGGWATPEERARVFEAIARDGRATALRVSLRRKDGSRMECLYHTEPITIGGQRHILLMAEDGSGRERIEAARETTRRAEAALAESERRYRDISLSIADCIYELDAGLAVTYAAERVKKLLGLEPAAMARVSALQLLEMETAPEARESTRRLLLSHREFRDVEHCIRRADGTCAWVQVSGLPRFDEGGGFLGYCGVLRDISAHKRAEEERARLAEQLLQAQKLESVGRLVGGLAHDFNNALTVINGYSDLALSRLDPGDPLRTAIGEIRTTGWRSAELTRQLLAFSRKQVIAPAPVVLNRLIEECRGMLERLVGEDVELVVAPDPDLGSALFDRGQFFQVLLNLMVNARDAMPGGGRVTLRTENVNIGPGNAAAYPGVSPGAYVVLSVIDTGVGMDEAVRRRVFEPFFTTKDEGHGTGLGLSTAHGIVRQNGGWILAASQPGCGATFSICLPRLEGAEQEMEDAVTVAVASPPRGSETVLVVEDDDAVRRVAVATLKNYGYKVLEAAGGSEALAVADHHPSEIQLVLADVVMPRMTGRELAFRLRQTRPRVGALYMSGYAANELVERGMIDAGETCVSKPFTPEGLAASVRKALGSGGGPPRIPIVDGDAGIRAFSSALWKRVAI